MKRCLWMALSLLCALGAAVTPAHQAGAASTQTGCAAVGTYVMRPHGPLPLALSQTVPITFPGRWGSGALRLSAYTGCGNGEKTRGRFTVARLYGPPIERARSSVGAGPSMPISVAGLHEISGTIAQDAGTNDAAAVTVTGAAMIGTAGCSACPASTGGVSQVRVPFGPLPGRLLWRAQDPQRIRLSFDLTIRLNGRSTRYTIVLSGVKQQ